MRVFEMNEGVCRSLSISIKHLLMNRKKWLKPYPGEPTYFSSTILI